jgi:hypothetical protein
MKGNRAMANTTVGRATARPDPRQNTTMRGTAFHNGLLQVVIILLALATALIHLDKALTLHVFGLRLDWLPGAMPARPHPGGAPGPGAPGGHKMGAPRGGMMPLPLSALFLLNFIGYVVLIVALYVPLPHLAPYQQRYHRAIRWALIVFAALTIYGYFAIVGGAPNALGELDKALEIGLIVFLLLEDRYTQVATRSAPTQLARA